MGGGGRGSYLTDFPRTAAPSSFFPIYLLAPQNHQLSNNNKKRTPFRRDSTFHFAMKLFFHFHLASWFLSAPYPTPH